MGAIAGSWAGLHGPREKTIEKTGQSGPGLHKGLGAQEGPGCRPTRPQASFKGRRRAVGGPGMPSPMRKVTRVQAGEKGSEK